jgi:hypothetical protein
MNILIYTHMPNFCFKDGGTVVQYYLAQLLEELGQNVRICTNNNVNTPNSIFSKFYNNEFPINDETIVIYCEGTQGNPLNAKKVVRWMLSELGQNVPKEWVNTWGKDELVYYFNSERKFCTSPEKFGSIYKLLTVIYMNPYIKQTNFNSRSGICYTLRKGPLIHKDKLNFVHPINSFEITRQHTQLDYIKIFNTYEYFMCYDSLTLLSVISALCGCITVIYKVDGLNKIDWINTTAFAEYCKYKNDYNIYGIAYGNDEMEFAKNTIHLFKEQWNEIIEFNKTTTLKSFIDDMQNFDKMINTINNNYFT